MLRRASCNEARDLVALETGVAEDQIGVRRDDEGRVRDDQIEELALDRLEEAALAQLDVRDVVQLEVQTSHPERALRHVRRDDVLGVP